MPHVRWKLKEFAQAHGLTGYVIAKQMVRSSDVGRPATAYRLMNDNPPSRVDLDTLTALISALRELVPGQQIEVKDLLEYVTSEPPSTEQPTPKGKKGSKGRVTPTNDEEAAF